MTQEDNMKQEDKELLLKYLCAALPYRMAIKDDYGDTTLLDYNDVHIQNYFEEILAGVVKPYLRSMLNMTEEERNEYLSVKMQETERVALAEVYRPEAIFEIMNWLLEHHFDFMGLIPKGLAIEVTENNNPYKD